MFLFYFLKCNEGTYQEEVVHSTWLKVGGRGEAKASVQHETGNRSISEVTHNIKYYSRKSKMKKSLGSVHLRPVKILRNRLTNKQLLS